MTWSVRIFSLLLLAGTIVAQDAPPDTAPDIAEAPAVVEQAADPAPAPEAPRAPSRPRARNRAQQWGEPRQGQRSEEHTSELQSPCNLVCRLLLEKKN